MSKASLAHYHRNIEAGRAASRKYYRQNREKVLERQRMQRYNLTEHPTAKACGICGQVPADRLCIDHDHETGKVRGLLCRTCNSGIGLLQDSPELLRRAIKWIEENS